MIGTVRRASELADAPAGLAGVVSLDDVDELLERGRFVDRIIEVSFSDNVDVDAAILRKGGTIAAYATRDDRPSFPFWPMLFDNVTIRLLGSDDFPLEAKVRAARDLTEAAADGALDIPIGEPLPLDRIADAHDLVDADSRRRVVLSIT